jgi:RNA-directed DNA polymerase
VFAVRAGWPPAEESAGAVRPLGIPTVVEGIVMTAAKIVLGPVFEADFCPISHGFRPKRSAHMACEVIRVAANRGRDWVPEIDVRDGFGSIDHSALMTQLGRRISDRAKLKLLRSWLRAGILLNGITTES